MSRDQRMHDNHALLQAQAMALELSLPLVVLFNVVPHSGHRSREHYEFMLSGLEEVSLELDRYNIPLIMSFGPAYQTLLGQLHMLKPAAVYFDFSPLNGPRALAKKLAGAVDAPCFVVDTHNCIPAWVASRQEEFAAHTFRRKVHQLLAQFLVEPETLQAHPFEANNLPQSTSFDDVRAHIRTVPASGISIPYRPGEHAAKEHVRHFIDTKLEHYALGRNNIAEDQQSGLSPYLHFGHVSSLRVALEVMRAAQTEPLLLHEPKMAHAGDGPSKADGMNALLEEMIVRKELADNFCFYGKSYTDLKGIKPWARQSLATHQKDPREHIYTLAELESAQTHDPAWNAAEQQLRRTGKIHGYMRMYWAKKMLEWTESAEQAVEYCIYLNDKYSIDGGDPNGYVGILWSIGGLHDRPWTERPIFGSVRYMNYEGLKRKFDVEAYIQQWT